MAAFHSVSKYLALRNSNDSKLLTLWVLAELAGVNNWLSLNKTLI